MRRSNYKIPFQYQISAKRWSRKSWLNSMCVGSTLQISNGRYWVNLRVQSAMSGVRAGTFIPTRKIKVT